LSPKPITSLTGRHPAFKTLSAKARAASGNSADQYGLSDLQHLPTPATATWQSQSYSTIPATERANSQRATLKGLPAEIISSLIASEVAAGLTGRANGVRQWKKSELNEMAASPLLFRNADFDLMRRVHEQLLSINPPTGPPSKSRPKSFPLSKACRPKSIRVPPQTSPSEPAA